MDDSELDREFEEYLDGSIAPNMEMADVEIIWIDDNPNVGSLHIRSHDVEKNEVEEVLLELPPEVEAKRSPTNPKRTCFWGYSRAGRGLFVVCEDRREGEVRYLTPITAFEPDNGYQYWENL